MEETSEDEEKRKRKRSIGMYSQVFWPDHNRVHEIFRLLCQIESKLKNTKSGADDEVETELKESPPTPTKLQKTE